LLGGESVLNLHELRIQGKSIREISRITGFARNTVRRYLRSRALPKPKPRPARSSKLAPFHDYIRTRVAQGVYNCEVLLAEIRRRGYDGGKSILKEFVRPLRPPKRPKAVMRFEVAPGEQAQVDWGIVTYQDQHGRQRHVYAFLMILSYSRDCYVEFVERADLSTFLRCHIHAFAYFGGVPRRILYDNMKIVRLGTNEAGKPVFHPRFAEFALTVGFQPQLCRPYRAQTKGRVERSVGYLKQNFVPGRIFTTLADLNQQVLAWCLEVRQRKHGTTGRRPCDMRQEEQLQPFIGAERLQTYLTEERTVGKDGFVAYEGSRYGVPWQYAGQRVEVRESGAQVEILHQGRRIALHPKALLPASVFVYPGQWRDLPMEPNRPTEKAMALQVGDPAVEVRSLSVYDALAEVGGHA
jgi:transposase